MAIFDLDQMSPLGIPESISACCGLGCHLSLLWLRRLFWDMTSLESEGRCVREAQKLQRHLWLMGRSILHPTVLDFVICICPSNPAPKNLLSAETNFQVCGGKW